MADLFAGTYNFVPSFEQEKITNQTASAAAGAFTSGISAGSGMRNAQSNQKMTDFRIKQGGGMDDGGPNGMDGFSSWLDGILNR